MLVPLNVAIKYLRYCIFKLDNNNYKQKYINQRFSIKKKLAKWKNEKWKNGKMAKWKNGAVKIVIYEILGCFIS